MQTEDKLVIRLPDGLRQTIKAMAAENERTMNAEVVYHLKRAYGASAAATGEGLENSAPAAASINNATLAGGASINQGN